MNLFKLTLIVIVFSAGCSRPTSVTSRSEDELHIRAAREVSNMAIRDHNVALMATAWTSDYHVVTSRNFETAGRQGNIDRYANEFATKPDIIYIRTPDNIQIFEKWKMAAETGHWVGRWTEKGEPVELKGTYFAKWHNEDGQWRIRAEVFVPLECEGDSFCKQSPL